jgi:homoserine kinase
MPGSPDKLAQGGSSAGRAELGGSRTDSRAHAGLERATAFAPASVGNVAIGFDILGFSVDSLGDRVTVARRTERSVAIEAVTGIAGHLPLEPEKNTAGRALMAMHEVLQPPFGFAMRIEKGIPLGSGLGGSAASAVGAVVAANALLDEPCTKLQLLQFAMHGEAVASGSLHVDNIAPSLFGGLVLTVGIDHPRVKQIPVPPDVRAVIVHPHMFLSTKQARAILKRTVDLSDFVWQTANLAGFISGCYTNDLDMIRASLEDVVIEPQRQALIPGFQEVRRAALGAGALGCSISGAGPTLFAWSPAGSAEAVLAAMSQEFAQRSIQIDKWITEVQSAGARVVEG